jgi:hypothetical protein
MLMPVADAITIALEEVKIVADMRPTEPLQYLPQRNISPLEISRCAHPACTKTFTVADGVAFPWQNPNQPHPSIYFFCSFECLVVAIPCELCGSA